MESKRIEGEGRPAVGFRRLWSEWCKRYAAIFPVLAALLGIFISLPLSAVAEHVTATVAADSGPQAVAVNPLTNRIYLANGNSTTVTVINGATNAATNVTVGSYPQAVAVNTVTNKVYVANLLPSISQFVTSLCTGYANRQNRAIDDKGTFTPPDSQPCRLLPHHQGPKRTCTSKTPINHHS
jgi:YVTN family beta-propeller protein